MAVLRTAHPYWIDRTDAREIPRYRSLRGETRVDVAIVGGGITGAVIAWVLAAEGLSVAVVEAHRIGRGSTLASTALLMQEPDEDVLGLRQRYGASIARRLWKMSRDASLLFIELIEQLRIRCELEPRDSIYFTLDQHARLRHEHKLRRQAGFGGQWLGEAELRRVANIDGSGIRTTGDAQVDPYKVCLGFVEAAERSGATIFEHTPAQRVEGRQGDMSIKTPQGRLTADSVIIATGFATPEFRPLAARFHMRHTYVLVTSKLSPRLRHRIGLSNVMLWDTNRPYHYARWTNDHRLMLGGGDRPQVRGPQRRRALREGTRDVKDYMAATG
jgi:glycine/D-amino acid oxidase-like deaminating enzyme